MTWSVLVLALLPQLAPVPAGEAILKRVEAALASVQDYTVTLDITADLEQANIPPMKATMYFKQPDRVHFESQGFALLPRDAFALSPARLLERFRIDSVAQDSVEGERVYRLRLSARDEKVRVRGAWIEVSPLRWTIDRGELSFGDERTITLRFRHERVGSVWLPSELSLTFSQAGAAKPEESLPDDQKPVQLGRGAPRKGGVVVRYSGYRLNTGLSDEIFVPSPVPAGR
jgi:hypothetical protein